MSVKKTPQKFLTIFFDISSVITTDSGSWGSPHART
jgi:hypothetical protein